MQKIMLTAALLALVGGGIAVAASANDGATVDPTRADCPGLIECPLTGDPVCADQCPLNDESTVSDEAAGELPLCCRDAK